MTTSTETARRYRFLPEDAPTFYRADSLAELLGVSPQTIRWYRHAGTGPRGFRAGGKSVLYAAAEVDRWLAERDDEQNAAALR